MGYISQPRGCWFVWLNRVAYIQSMCVDGIATKPYTKMSMGPSTHIRNEAPIGCEPRNILTHRNKRYLVKERDGNCLLVSKLY